jgi:hypothetical protein
MAQNIVRTLYKIGNTIIFGGLLLLLYIEDIHPNTGFYWVFLIFFGLSCWVSYVNGISRGIYTSYLLFTDMKEEQEDKNEAEKYNISLN